MPEYLPTAPYRGTRDFLPPEMSVRTQVFGHLYEVLERFGYLRYDGPINRRRSTSASPVRRSPTSSSTR